MRYVLILLTFLSSLSFLSSEEINAIRPGKDYALFFAVNQYDKMRSLSNPINDAEIIAKELTDNYSFITEVVKNPTLDQIEEILESYKKYFATGRYAPDGQLLLFFSGHGMVENKNGFFLAKDSDPEKLHRTAFLYEYWRPFLNTIDCKHILVAIDACYSGTFDPSWWSRSGRFGRPGELSEGERLLEEHEKYKTRIFFTSATEEESPDDSKFARKFLEGLRSTNKDDDGILTSTELFSHLEKATPRPHSGEFGDDDPGSSFLFIHSSKMNTRAIDDDENWLKALQTNTEQAYLGYIHNFRNGKYIEIAKDSLRAKELKSMDKERLIKIRDNKLNVGIHEVTNAEFVRFLDDSKEILNFERRTGVISKAGGQEIIDLSCSGCGDWQERILFNGNSFEVIGNYRNHPVVMVTWYGAIEYCNWLSRKKGVRPAYSIEGTKVGVNWESNGFRLPTEKEWEMIASLPVTKDLSHENCDGEDMYRYTAPALSPEPEAHQLMHLGGNVSEWCWDFYDTSDRKAKYDERESAGFYRVTCGGSWNDKPGKCGISKRNKVLPFDQSNTIGFRMVRNAF